MMDKNKIKNIQEAWGKQDYNWFIALVKNELNHNGNLDLVIRVMNELNLEMTEQALAKIINKCPELEEYLTGILGYKRYSLEKINSIENGKYSSLLIPFAILNGQLKKSKYEGKNLEEVTNIPYNKLVMILKKKKKGTKTIKIIKKAYGTSYKEVYTADKLNDDERKSLGVIIWELKDTCKRFFNRKNRKSTHDGKTLSQITGIPQERLLILIGRKHQNGKPVKLLRKWFGQDYTEKFVGRNLTSKQKDKFYEIITDLKIANEKYPILKKHQYDGLTLPEITGFNLKELNIIMGRKRPKFRTYHLLIAMFDEDLSGKFDSSRLNAKDKKTLVAAICNLNLVSEEAYNNRNKNVNEGKTLMEIVGCSKKELIDELNLMNNKSKTYSLFMRIFGEDLNGVYKRSNLSRKEKCLFNAGVKNLKNKLNSRANKKEEVEYLYPNDLMQKSPFFVEPFITIANYIPAEYQEVTELYLGTKDGYMHSKESVAMILKKELDETEILIEKGLLIFQELVTRVYNNKVMVLTRHKNADV